MSDQPIEAVDFVADSQFGEIRGGPFHLFKVVGADMMPADDGKPALLEVTLRKNSGADAIATVSVLLDIRDILKSCSWLIDKRGRSVLR